MKLAKLEYKQGSLEVVEFGSHVQCAVTGELIPLEDLRYWNVERQEPYVDGRASLKRELELKK